MNKRWGDAERWYAQMGFSLRGRGPPGRTVRVAFQTREVAEVAEDKNPGAPEKPGRAGREMSEAEIDRNLAETFPASDPPSWTLGMDHRREPRSTDGEPSAQGESKLPPSNGG